MTIFTIERSECFTADVEVDFGQGGTCEVRVDVEDQDLDIDIHDHDIEYLDEDEALELATSLREHHPEAMELEVTAEAVIKYLANNMKDLGTILDLTISRYNVDYISGLADAADKAREQR